MTSNDDRPTRGRDTRWAGLSRPTVDWTSAVTHPRLLPGLVHADPWVMRVLHHIRASGLPDAVVGGGVVRDLVWGQRTGTGLTQLPCAMSTWRTTTRSTSAERETTGRPLPSTGPTRAGLGSKNQATVHTWYHMKFGDSPVLPVATIADAVGTWPETATSVGLCLDTRRRQARHRLRTGRSPRSARRDLGGATLPASPSRSPPDGSPESTQPPAGPASASSRRRRTHSLYLATGCMGQLRSAFTAISPHQTYGHQEHLHDFTDACDAQSSRRRSEMLPATEI